MCMYFSVGVCIYVCLYVWLVHARVNKQLQEIKSINVYLHMQEGLHHTNTFYLRLYGVGHMIKDHSDSERGNPLAPHGLLFPISSKDSFI